jgi:hypothetical protein
MDSYNQSLMIRRQSKEIIIQQNSPTKKKEEFRTKEYSLNNSIFDPSKSSPPNDFLLKLQLRMSHYDSFSNVNNLISE